MMGVVLFTAVLYVVVNIAVDLLYLVIDPRLQERRRETACRASPSLPSSWRCWSWPRSRPAC